MLKDRFRNQVLCHGFESGRNDFEVHVNGVIIFSKRRTGYFPDLDLIVSEVRMVLEDPSHKPRTVTETESCCSFRYTSCCQVS